MFLPLFYFLTYAYKEGLRTSPISPSPSPSLKPSFSFIFLLAISPTHTPSNSTGASFIAGVLVSINGVCVDTPGEVLCGKVAVRETGDMGLSDVESGGGGAPEVVTVGGDMGVWVG
jgi:hypothetical protein